MLTLYNRQNLLPPAAAPSGPPPEPPKPRPKFDLQLAQQRAKASDRRYTLSRTHLGDHALHWVESWWAGLFCVVDIATYLPGSRFVHPTDTHEVIYTGEGASAFCTTGWEWSGQDYGKSQDVWTGQKAPTPFAEDLLLPHNGKAPPTEMLIGETLSSHQSDEVQRWKSQRRRLPFWRKPLALPNLPIGADLSAPDANVTYVMMR